jgi:hypothetical protein
LTACPCNFPTLSSFTWESASTGNLECVGPNYICVCPNTAPECLPLIAASSPTPPPPPPSPTSSDCQAAYTLWSEECALNKNCSQRAVDQDPLYVTARIAVLSDFG